MNRAIALAALTACITLGGAVATAQPTGDLYTPTTTPSMRADAFSARVNPAQLAFVDRFGLGLLVEHDASNDRDVSVGWANAFRAGPVGASIGADFVDAGDDARFTRVALGLAAGSDRVAFGWGWSGYRSAHDRATDRFATSTLGLTWRAAQTVGLSTTLDHVGRPRFAGSPVQRVWGLGIGVREPTDRASLDVSWRGPVDDWVDAGHVLAHLRIEPLPGWALYGHADLRPVDGTLDSAGGGIELVAGSLRSRVGAWAPDGASARQTLAFEITRPPRDMVGSSDVLLRIDLAGNLPERPGVTLFGSPGPVLTDHLVTLDEIARNGHVGGVYVVLGGLTGGGAQLQELRMALQRVRDAGGLVVVYLERATIRDLWIASVADHVIASPTVNVLDTGLSTTRTYLAGLLSLLGIEAQFVRIGDYKTAPERFTQREPSDEANEALDRFFDVLWHTMRDDLAESLEIETDTLVAALEDAPLTLDELDDLGLVDAVLPPGDVGEHLVETFGRPLRPARALDSPTGPANWWFDPFEVAVLHITGSIVSGQSSPGFFTVSAMTGDATVEAACRSLANDPTVDAVIVRIDSPGGSAVASDRMLRALRDLADAVPVHVSMADVAGSGGYYVAAISEDVPVHASPTTLTGSIGIYAGTFALDTLLARLDVNRVHDERGGPSSFYDGRRWTEERQDQVLASITVSYELFLDRVATARGLTTDAVDEVGRGRTWPGVDALEHDLVDELDGFVGAVHDLRESLGIDPRMPTTLRHVATPGIGGVAGALASVRASGPTTPDLLTAFATRLGAHGGLALLDAWLVTTPGEAMAMMDVAVEGL